ncbi:MAG: potassium channel protein [Lentisphaeria bacterium]|nr:potassium channel protein [Candidatus Neomarinimicrobiota bacterium]MCF7843105.1 potassium channel protein [Lentisphaeria bacterium]
MFDGRLTGSLILFALLILLGTAGYVVFDGVDWFDALYMTLITITTVGFQEEWTLSFGTKIWTLFIMLAGIGMFFFIFGQIAQRVIDFKRIGRIHMQNQINRLSDHYIVCGFGRMGSAVSQEFAAEAKPFVVIEQNTEKLERIRKFKYLLVEGDATKDDVLHQAGIKRAKGLIAVLANDADNLFLTLTARSISTNLYILARSIETASTNKLIRVGANKVVNPYETAGHKIARLAIKPGVVEFLEIATNQAKVDLTMETIPVQSGSDAEGNSLSGLNLRKNYNLIVAAITTPGRPTRFNPDPDEKLGAGDILLTIGNMKNLKRFEELCSTGD